MNYNDKEHLENEIKELVELIALGKAKLDDYCDDIKSFFLSGSCNN